MPKKKKYTFWYCRDCEMDFLTPLETKANCPKCADRLYVDKLKDIWIERPFNYKRPWSAEEDELILTGTKQGYTRKEISESLDGRTEKAVERRLLRLNKVMNN
jgi:predicted Zn-ribbon and HTH transcriptional regulator